MGDESAEGDESKESSSREWRQKLICPHRDPHPTTESRRHLFELINIPPDFYSSDICTCFALINCFYDNFVSNQEENIVITVYDVCSYFLFQLLEKKKTQTFKKKKKKKKKK